MVNISIDVTDLGGEARPGDKVVLWKPAAAGSASHAGRVISTAPVDVFLTNGKATVPDVEPGDMRVLLQCRGVESQGPIPVVVPDGTGTVTLRSLIESQFEYSPPIVSAVQQAADNAAASERAAIQAQVRSEAAADRAETRVDEAINNGANLIRAEVKQDADRAVGAKNGAQAAQSAAESSAASAQESAAAAAESAGATEADRQEVTTARGETLAARDTAVGAAETATAQARTATDSAGAAAGSAAAAGASETRAAASAQTATQQADRATSEADRSKTEADRAASEAEASSVKAVAEKVNELLAGAPEAYDTLLEIAEELERSQSAEAALVKEIAGKANTKDVPTTDDGYNTRNASNPATDYPAGVSYSMHNGRTRGWNGVIQADTGYTDFASFVMVQTLRQGDYPKSTTQLVFAYNDEHRPVFMRKWYGEAWGPFRSLTDDGHTHAIADTTGLQSALDGKANTATVTSVSSRVTTLENAQPIIVSALPDSPLPGRIYLVTE